MRTPDAVANIRGSSEYQGISGKSGFYQTEEGVLVVTDVWGLPQADDNRNNCDKYDKCCKCDCDNGNKCNSPVYGYHNHSGNRCQGNNDDAFTDAKAHYNQNDFHTQPSGASGTKIACGVIESEKYTKK